MSVCPAKPSDWEISIQAEDISQVAGLRWSIHWSATEVREERSNGTRSRPSGFTSPTPSYAFPGGVRTPGAVPPVLLRAVFFLPWWPARATPAPGVVAVSHACVSVPDDLAWPSRRQRVMPFAPCWKVIALLRLSPTLLHHLLHHCCITCPLPRTANGAKMRSGRNPLNRPLFSCQASNSGHTCLDGKLETLCPALRISISQGPLTLCCTPVEASHGHEVHFAGRSRQDAWHFH
jgi:hypothetical protein